jgi:hypothetical protein
MDKAVANALKERRELKRRLAEVERFLRMYKQFSCAPNAESNDSSSVKTVNESTHIEKKTSIFPDLLALSRRGPASVVHISKGILQDFGQPLTRGELAAELEIRKVHLPGKDKETRGRYVGTILWRHSNIFEQIPGRGYWLKDVPIPETEQEREELRKSHTLT